MVRVGGGWVALDEFLVKNDPCRGMYISSLHIFLIKCNFKCILFIRKKSYCEYFRSFIVYFLCKILSIHFNLLFCKMLNVIYILINYLFNLFTHLDLLKISRCSPRP